MKYGFLCFALLCIGCGSSNPTNPATPVPDSPAERPFDHVTAAEANAYIAAINEAFISIDVFFSEYGGVTAEVTQNAIPVYWSRQFIRNMIARLHAILGTLHATRPENPYLRRLHTEEFEAAFEDYLDGVMFLEQNLDFLTPEVIDGLNMRMGAGNVHIIRLQIFLRDLTGAEVSFGGNEPGDGQTF